MVCPWCLQSPTAKGTQVLIWHQFQSFVWSFTITFIKRKDCLCLSSRSNKVKTHKLFLACIVMCRNGSYDLSSTWRVIVEETDMVTTLSTIQLDSFFGFNFNFTLELIGFLLRTLLSPRYLCAFSPSSLITSNFSPVVMQPGFSVWYLSLVIVCLLRILLRNWYLWVCLELLRSHSFTAESKQSGLLAYQVLNKKTKQNADAAGDAVRKIGVYLFIFYLPTFLMKRKLQCWLTY